LNAATREDSSAAPPGTSLDVRARIALAAILGAAAVLRFADLANVGLWFDEANTYSIARGTADEIVARLRDDASPPLYYFLLHGWIAIFGASEAALRSLSAVFGVGLVAALFCAGREIAGTLLSVWGFARLLSRGGWGRAAWFAAATIAALYTHAIAIYLLPLHCAMAAVSGGWRGKVVLLITAFAAVALAYIPWLTIVLAQLHEGDAYSWFSPIWRSWPWWFPAVATLRSFSPAGSYIAYGDIVTREFLWVPFAAGTALAALGAFVSLGASGRGSHRAPRRVWLPAYLVIPPLCAIVTSHWKMPHYVAGRVDQLVFPAYALLVALGLDAIADPVARVAPRAARRFGGWIAAFVLLLWAACGIYCWQSYFPGYRGSAGAVLSGGDREVARAIRERIGPADVVLCTSLSRMTIDYYLSGTGVERNIFSYPAATVASMGGQAFDPAKADPARLEKDVNALLEQLWLASGPGGNLYVVFVRQTVNEPLAYCLPRSRLLGEMQTLGVYKQRGVGATIHLFKFPFQR
jgi:hypothetical protein